MAVKTKRTNIGNYITKVNNYDIRMKLTYRKKENGKQEVGSHDFIVARGSKIIKTGLKTKQEALDFANSN